MGIDDTCFKDMFMGTPSLRHLELDFGHDFNFSDKSVYALAESIVALQPHLKYLHLNFANCFKIESNGFNKVVESIIEC